MLQAKVDERDVEIETWRGLYMKMWNQLKSTNWGLDSSVASLKEMSTKYDKMPYRINYFQSRGANKRLKKKIRKAKEGAAAYIAK